MSNLNKIILIGRLVDNPESRTSMEGVAVTKFRLAVNRPAGAGVDHIDVISWRSLAEVASQHFKRGSLVLVEGRIQIRSFENQSGERNWATEVVAKKLQALDSKTSAEKTAAAAALPESGFEEIEELPEDDLPF